MSWLFISPHNDDETLFGAFSIMARPRDCHLVIAYDGFKHEKSGAASIKQRRAETIEAATVMGLGIGQIEFLGLNDGEADESTLVQALVPVFSKIHDYAMIPAWDKSGNVHHNLFDSAIAGSSLPSEVGHAIALKRYATYNSLGKVTSSFEVLPPTPDAVIKKHMALSKYTSQIWHPDCREHFVRDMREYLIF